MSGGCFHEKGDFGRRFGEDFEGSFGDHFQPNFFTLFHVGTHVADDERNSELTAAAKFAGEGVFGFFTFFWFGSAEVDEVGIVADNVLVTDSGFFEGLIEFLDLVFGDVFAVPHLGGRGEDLEGGAADFFGVFGCFVESAAGGHMGSDEGGGHGVEVTFCSEI